MTARVLIIGWDGADWDVLDPMLERGEMPNLANLIASGTRGVLQSTVPINSWAAWSTFLTGVHPGRHGVFDFVQRDVARPGDRVPVSSSSIKAPTFLELLSRAGHEVRAANIPVTFPPIPVRGRMIAGVAIPPGADFIYPKAWAAELSRLAPFPTNGMEWTRFRQDPRELVDEAARIVAQRSDSFEALLDGDWSAAVCVFVAPDRLQHPLGAYLLPSHPKHVGLHETELAEALRGVFRLLDRQLGRLGQVAGPDATVILLSDHGFRPIDRAANLDRILASLGLSAPTRTGQIARALRRTDSLRRLVKTRIGRAIRGGVPRPGAFDWSHTLVYQSGSAGQLSINLKGREAYGVVDPGDYERVRMDAREALLAFRDPETGDRPVGEVLFAREIYHGQQADRAPDLIVLPTDLWTFAHTGALTGSTEWPSGAHRRAGIIAASGPGIASGSLPERDIADLAPTILALLGVSYDSFDGRQIDPLTPARVTAAAVEPGEAAERAEVSEDQQEAIAEHLRDLGYIE